MVNHDDLQQGTRIGLYEIVSEIGRGGNAIVYQARAVDTHRNVALKIAKPYLFEEEISSFEWEARVGEILGQHPNIVNIYERGVHEDRPYLIMDFVDGTNAEKLMERGRLSVNRIGSIVRDAAQGLEHMHGKGIIHCDVKTGNILVDERCARISDFGTAYDSRRKWPKPELGTINCTIQFASPEHAWGQELDARSDVYSLGASMYQLLTGKPPFDDGTTQQIAMAVMHTMPVSVQAREPSVPAEIADICMRCLEKEPIRRFQSARETVLSLDIALAKLN